MPGEDGYALIEKLRARERERGERLLIAIALTAYVRAEDRLRALSAGYQAHVSKPVEMAELLTVIASLLISQNIRREDSDRRQPLAGAWVAVVDDEADARALITAVLEVSGARVTAFGSAREALDLLMDETGPRPDILISDLAMPGEDGYSLIRKLREWERTHGGALPAVALTAYGRANSSNDSARRSGKNSLIVLKPDGAKNSIN